MSELPFTYCGCPGDAGGSCKHSKYPGVGTSGKRIDEVIERIRITEASCLHQWIRIRDLVKHRHEHGIGCPSYGTDNICMDRLYGALVICANCEQTKELFG